jgi:hypothetical protein
LGTGAPQIVAGVNPPIIRGVASHYLLPFFSGGLSNSNVTVRKPFVLLSSPWRKAQSEGWRHS